MEETIRASKDEPTEAKEEEKETRNKCNHGPRDKCLNCLGVTKDNKDEVSEKCLHGPDAHCVNCLGVTRETFQNVSYQCNHPADQRCPNCAANEVKIKDARHQSFENFVEEIKIKCK